VAQLSQKAVETLWAGMDAPLAMYQSEMDNRMMAFAAPVKDAIAALSVDLVREKSTTGMWQEFFREVI